MASKIEFLRAMALPDLRKYVKALRAKIKEKRASESPDIEVRELDEELKLAESVISEKEIAEAQQTMARNHVAEVLKKTKP